jgi:hypothetical protein
MRRKFLFGERNSGNENSVKLEMKIVQLERNYYNWKCISGISIYITIKIIVIFWENGEK